MKSGKMPPIDILVEGGGMEGARGRQELHHSCGYLVFGQHMCFGHEHLSKKILLDKKSSCSILGVHNLHVLSAWEDNIFQVGLKGLLYMYQ
jgi:hypothetical protein